jgi:aspartate kinase
MPIQDILNASLLNQISYRSNRTGFYGATVIHPKNTAAASKKTLYVKSFINPIATSVPGVDLEPYLPCFIVKRNQL